MLRKLFFLIMLSTGAGILLLSVMVWDGLRAHPDSFAGLPRPAQFSWLRLTHVIDKPGFVLGYSEARANPLWVAYRLEFRPHGPIGARPEHFRIDRRTLRRVTPADYRGSGFDRGHLAPNYAMARFFGREAQLASFAMSNIVPQRPALNQKLWQRLEEIEADVYSGSSAALWVVTGPLFDERREWLDGSVEVPDAFFRIWLRRGAGGQPEALAFIVPQAVSGYEPLDRFVVSVDAVEAASGLDFFHRLDEASEAALEAAVNPPAWNLAAHARRPPRY